MSIALSRGANAAAKIRQILEKQYPLTNFSVCSQIYATSSWVRVFWLDGATKKDVEAIVSSGGILSSNDHSVSFDRGYSKQVYQAAVNEMSTWPDWESVDFSKVEYWVNDDGSCYLQGGVRRVKNGRCFYLANEVYRLLLEVSFYHAGDDVPCAGDDDDISLNPVLNQGLRNQLLFFVHQSFQGIINDFKT